MLEASSGNIMVFKGFKSPHWSLLEASSGNMMVFRSLKRPPLGLARGGLAEASPGNTIVFRCFKSPPLGLARSIIWQYHGLQRLQESPTWPRLKHHLAISWSSEASKVSTGPARGINASPGNIIVFGSFKSPSPRLARGITWPLQESPTGPR